MGFDDRFGYLLLGCFIGFILGRMSKSISDILDAQKVFKEELDEVDDIVKKLKSEGGYIRPNFGQVILLLILALTVYASVISQLSSNRSNDTADDLKVVVNCNQVFLGVTLNALTERSTFSTDAAKKNIDLQESQHNFFNILLHQPPPSSDEVIKSATKYNNDSGQYISVSLLALRQIQNNPIPTIEQFTRCLADKQTTVKGSTK